MLVTRHLAKGIIPMSRKRKSKILPLLMLLVLTLPSVRSFAQSDDENEGTAGVQKKGVVFNIAPDREVEKIGGVYQPEGLDIYLKRHLDAIYQKLDTLETGLVQLDRDLKLLSEDLKKGRAITNSEQP